MIRVISVEVADARMWHAEVKRRQHGQFTHPETIERARQAAATADLLGVPCGIVTGVREEQV